MLRELPQLYMFPWKYFFSTTQERNEEIKRELFYLREGSHTHVFS
jgi:hypothetical protein